MKKSFKKKNTTKEKERAALRKRKRWRRKDFLRKKSLNCWMSEYKVSQDSSYSRNFNYNNFIFNSSYNVNCTKVKTTFNVPSSAPIDARCSRNHGGANTWCCSHPTWKQYIRVALQLCPSWGRLWGFDPPCDTHVPKFVPTRSARGHPCDSSSPLQHNSRWAGR